MPGMKVITTVGLLFLLHLSWTMHVPTETSNVATTQLHTTEFPLTRYEQGLEDYDEMKQNERQGKGMMDMDDEHNHDYDHHPEIEDMSQPKVTAPDPWVNYYNFLINEGSFKFWAVFQLVTAVLLIYSAFAAVYYAKFNVSSTDYDYYYDFFSRSGSGRSDSTSWFGISPETFQRIVNAISSKKYS